MSLIQLHFFAVSFWFGLLAAESVLELVGAGKVERWLAQVHRWIDLLCEGPAIITIFVTGGVLLSRIWPAPALLLVKAGLATVALLVNLYCVGLVLARAQEQDETRFRRLSAKVRLTGFAIPFGLAAFVIGLWFLPQG